VLLDRAAAQFGERGLGSVAGMCSLASEGLRSADSDLAISQRFLRFGVEK
jgi:hypothetical protein